MQFSLTVIPCSLTCLSTLCLLDLLDICSTLFTPPAALPTFCQYLTSLLTPQPRPYIPMPSTNSVQWLQFESITKCTAATSQGFFNNASLVCAINIGTVEKTITASYSPSQAMFWIRYISFSLHHHWIQILILDIQNYRTTSVMKAINKKLSDIGL